jgi:tetratricopeptide (TPR) repeat protein
MDPTNAAAEFDLGNLLLDEPDQAIGHLERAVALDPHWSRAKNNLAVALLKVGRTDVAFSLLQQAIADDPADADAHANIGLLLMQAGRLPEAMAEFKAALTIDPDNKPALKGMQVNQRRQGTK